jgi:hypothetical protein
MQLKSKYKGNGQILFDTNFCRSIAASDDCIAFA